MNLNAIHEENHGKFYNNILWTKRQIIAQLKVNSLSCPKEEKIMYTPRAFIIKVLGMSLKIKGLFQLPKFVSVLTDKFEDDIVKTKRNSDELNQYMFKYSYSYFKSKQAKNARKVLCTDCLFIHCNYNIKKEA